MSRADLILKTGGESSSWPMLSTRYAGANSNGIHNVKDDPSYVDNVDGFTWD